MVLEALTNPFRMEQRPASMVLLGFLYATVGLFLGYWVFREHASLIMVFLTTMACLPLIVNTLKLEEEKDVLDYSEMVLLKEHGRALSAFVYLFIGMVVAFSLWYAVLPSGSVASMFSAQTQTINTINGRITGMSFAQSMVLFGDIFLNNVRVLIFCILFSFLYGAGAIFILTWNASVIGTAIGNYVRSSVSTIAGGFGLTQTLHYMQAITIGLLKYSIHGIPEILAYFTAGLAGGIISIAVVRHDLATRKFEHVLLDSADLLMISLGILLLAALLEVWVTPFVFS
ncbi:MAG: stage II sporulation protein M [Nanoarchaeota archaeon]